MSAGAWRRRSKSLAEPVAFIGWCRSIQAARTSLRRATHERRTAEPLLLPCARCTRSGRVQRGPAIGRIIIRYGRRHPRGVFTQILLVERTVFADHK